MSPMIFTVTFLILLLAGSWLFYLSYYLRNRQKHNLALKNFEESQSRLREEVVNTDSLVNLLANVHEIVLESFGDKTKPVLARMILSSACQIMGCAVGSLMILDQETQELKIVAAQDISQETCASLGLKLGEGLLSEAALIGKIKIFDDLTKEARVSGLDLPGKSLMLIPLKLKDRIMGLLSIFADEPHHIFEEKKIRLLNILARQSTIALENLGLYKNLQIFYCEMVEALAERLVAEESKDKNETLRFYARKIAQELKLPDSITMYVEFATILRGIGKSDLNELILHKPGNLTPKELEEVKKAPKKGHDWVSKVKFLLPVGPMILYHQEHWDGKGYPSGLKGNEIPLGSRIVSVLAAFHSMTTDRPYRKALPEKQAIGELKNQAGTQFDPKVVETFVKIFENEKEKIPQGQAFIRNGKEDQSVFENFWEWN
ncbi:MAG: GAF domain-containing protein [Elusimicrobia bacterium]|nr:GAF domain-containing protein [Elusimicrobiota bacterium]